MIGAQRQPGRTGWRLRGTSVRAVVSSALVVPALLLGATAAGARPMRDAPAAAGRQASLHQSGQRTAGARQTPVTGQITAHDGRFWLGTSSIDLRGINASPIEGTYMTNADFAQIASWNMNFVRLRVHWSDIEPTAPTPNGQSWTHDWDAVDMQNLKDSIAWATANGEYVLIENALASNYPTWLYTSAYNSHSRDYPDTPSLNTDYWSDQLMQQFTKDYLKYVAGQLAPIPGIVGYEPIDEANPGTLAETRATTQLLLGVQYDLAAAVRNVDPPRVIFFTTRESLGAGLPQANLANWGGLGNVAFDVHDYFGGRWGVALNMDPADPDYGETMQPILNFTLNPDTAPYLGTTQVHQRFIQFYQSFLTPFGIPLFIGEFGGKGEDEANINTLFGTMTSAFNATGVSWAAWSFNGANSVLKSDGSPEPWLGILAAAADQS